MVIKTLFITILTTVNIILSKLLDLMMKNGTFTHINHPNNEKLFENASIDVIIYRYVKDKNLEKKVLYNNKSLYITNSEGLITFSETENENYVLIKDYFDIYVGIVSGKDEVYKNEELGNISVITNENKIEKFIFIDKLPSGNKKIDKYLLENKDVLINRRIKKFNENNWFEWGAPRNISTMKNNIGKDCIYVCNIK
jgi:adenine-specific DNA-methyltransferase